MNRLILLSHHEVATVSTRGYEARIRELVEDFTKLAAIGEPLLTVRRVMRQQFEVLHKMLTFGLERLVLGVLRS